ncbi:MAG: GNAT family N-acetyltransferase [Mangrovibacterium sp.]
MTLINDTIDSASKERGTGIARRTDEYITAKINEGKGIIALEGEKFAGFCYIESWGHNKFVANSGLIVHKDFRGRGLARLIKAKAFEVSRAKYPNAKIFGLTTGLAVMKINHDLGYHPVTFSELTDDEAFWKGCQSCVNYDILVRTGRSKCLCTGMLFDPVWEKKKMPHKEEKKKHSLADIISKLRGGKSPEAPKLS